MLEGWEREPQEVKHLKILAICQYFYAVGAVLCGTLMAAYPSILKWAFENSPRNQQDLPPETIQMMTVMFVAYAVVIYAIAIASVIAGIMIAKRKGWLFLMILSGIDAIFVPVGTALGICCLITLNKPHVKAWFTKPEGDAPPPVLP